MAASPTLMLGHGLVTFTVIVQRMDMYMPIATIHPALVAGQQQSYGSLHRQWCTDHHHVS